MHRPRHSQILSILVIRRYLNALKLDLSERDRHAEWYALHRDLLHLRREDPVIAQQEREAIDGAVIGPAAFVLRYAGHDGDDRLY